MAKGKAEMGGVKRKQRPQEEDEGQDGDDEIVWPPTVVIHNTRLCKAEDGRWTGLGNVEMSQILRDLGHPCGRPKSVWNKEGHKGYVLVQYEATPEGLKEAERLHELFKANGRGRSNWDRVRPFWHGLPGHDGIEEGPDFVRIDKETNQELRVLYGYLAEKKDAGDLPKKKHRHCMTIKRSSVEA